jgi:hypothetical protein
MWARDADPKRVEDLFERGYTVFEAAYSTAEVAWFRELMLARWREVGSPALRANPPYRPAPDIEIGPAGIIFHKLSTHHPETIPRLYKSQVVAAMRALMGDDMQLELPAGVFSDRSRPFFDWHVHIDGVDDAFYQNRRQFPRFERSLRATHLLYLDGLSDDTGQLLVMPRRLTDPTEPPFDPKLENWEGMRAIECSPGSVVVLEQCTWHAARQMRVDGVRAFVGSYFAAADAPKTPLSDPALAEYAGEHALFASLCPRGAAATAPSAERPAERES